MNDKPDSSWKDASRKLGYEIAGDLEKRFGLLSYRFWDLDEAAKWIAMMLPIPWQEAQYEQVKFDETIKQAVRPRGPSPIRELKKALGMEKHTVLECIKRATDIVKEHREGNL